MDDLLFSLNTVLPLLVMMAVGFAARCVGWLDDASTHRINACVFRIFLPLLLCFNIVDTDLGESFDGLTLLYALATTLAAFLFLFWLVPRLCRDRASCGVIIQGVARSNYAIFGIPLVMTMYPQADTSIAALMVAVVVPVFNVMSTVALTVFTGKRSKPSRVLRDILLNPLILATLAGFALWWLRIDLPPVLESPLRSLGSVATPLALFLLGASMDFQKAKANGKTLVISVLGRLVAMPLVFLSLAVALGIRDVSLAALIAVYASPTSVSSFPMAQQMGGNGDLAGAQVVFTTALRIPTVFLLIYVLRSLGYLA